ncbi:VWA domain-containing protein [Actinokineospora pegani]|uniref:VWA domain-containing protein n=1 Tax=Actinokineospora pegani TaxID=2654637 RepID=UPI0012EAA13F|nr:VWA domain-containing protein [Actinokineospora pegani]
MTTHLVADPNATGAAVFPARPGWLTLSAALADEVEIIADRDDLLVTIAPGAGGGAPACFFPARALIEVDGKHLGVDPATVDPAKLADRARYEIVWGLLTHECGHAKHTAWEPPDNTPPGVVQAALLLEEPRMEAAQIRRRPDDRHWLRASATQLILADTDATDPARAPQMTKVDAAQTAALLLARVDSGILTAAETEPVARVVESVLGADLLNDLCDLWREALRTADDDVDAMIDLGQRWCQAVGIDPDDPDAGTSGDPGQPNGSGGPPPPSVLTQAIGEALANVAQAVADDPPPQDPADAAAAQRAASDAADAANRATARTVFSGAHLSPHGQGGTTITGKRKPTPDEYAAAQVLARALSTAGVRDRVAVKSTSPVPPGRLRMRGALAADAQRAAGAMVTAEPFARITRHTAPAPPLRLGVACDVSGSMGYLSGPVASTAWILAYAGHRASVPVTTATVIYGAQVRPVTHPGTVPHQVTEFAANDGAHDVATAAAALDGALGLSQPGAARLLVIVSDGHYLGSETDAGQKQLDRLRAAGCAILWLTTDPTDNPMRGATVHQLSDPTNTAQAIGRAATAALRATAR